MWMIQEHQKWCLKKAMLLFRRKLLPSANSRFENTPIDKIKHRSHETQEPCSEGAFSVFYWATIYRHLCLLQHVFAVIPDWSFIVSSVLRGVIWQPDLANDCVWNRDEPSTPTPHSYSLLFHNDALPLRYFFPQWLIIISPSMYLLLFRLIAGISRVTSPSLMPGAM